LQAGLGFAVALGKPGGFLGRDAVAALKGTPLTQRLLQVLCLDPEPLMFHGEVVRRNGKPVGYVRAASYGHTLGGAVGLAMVDASGEVLDNAWISQAEWTLEIGAGTFPALVSLRPLYDPTNSKIKA
jgi:4-methylaminobutanoate oxidase (formaldehyde-forming)